MPLSAPPKGFLWPCCQYQYTNWPWLILIKYILCMCMILSISHALIYLILNSNCHWTLPCTWTGLTVSHTQAHSIFSSSVLLSPSPGSPFPSTDQRKEESAYSSSIFEPCSAKSACAWLPFHQPCSSEPHRCVLWARLLSWGHGSKASCAYERGGSPLRSCRRGGPYWHLQDPGKKRGFMCLRKLSVTWEAFYCPHMWAARIEAHSHLRWDVQMSESLRAHHADRKRTDLPAPLVHCASFHSVRTAHPPLGPSRAWPTAHSSVRRRYCLRRPPNSINLGPLVIYSGHSPFSKLLYYLYFMSHACPWLLGGPRPYLLGFYYIPKLHTVSDP